MRRKLTLLAATLLIALATVFTSVAPSTIASVPSCRTQCRVAYDKCVKETTNPGGLNQCRKAYQTCLSGC